MQTQLANSTLTQTSLPTPLKGLISEALRGVNEEAKNSGWRAVLPPNRYLKRSRVDSVGFASRKAVCLSVGLCGFTRVRGLVMSAYQKHAPSCGRS